jgi:hypothetical protein
MAYTLGSGLEPSHITLEGYDDVVMQVVEQGPPRIRRDKSRANRIATVEWTCPSGQLNAFAGLREAAYDDTWVLPLTDEAGGYTLYECQYLPGTWRISPTGSVYTITCQVEIIEVYAP